MRRVRVELACLKTFKIDCRFAQDKAAAAEEDANHISGCKSAIWSSDRSAVKRKATSPRSFAAARRRLHDDDALSAAAPVRDRKANEPSGGNLRAGDGRIKSFAQKYGPVETIIPRRTQRFLCSGRVSPFSLSDRLHSLTNCEMRNAKCKHCQP